VTGTRLISHHLYERPDSSRKRDIDVSRSTGYIVFVTVEPTCWNFKARTVPDTDVSEWRKRGDWLARHCTQMNNWVFVHRPNGASPGRIRGLSGELISAQPDVQLRARDAESSCGLRFVAGTLGERLRDQVALDRVQIR